MPDERITITFEQGEFDLFVALVFQTFAVDPVVRAISSLVIEDNLDSIESLARKMSEQARKLVAEWDQEPLRHLKLVKDEPHVS